MPFAIPQKHNKTEDMRRKGMLCAVVLESYDARRIHHPHFNAPFIAASDDGGHACHTPTGGSTDSYPTPPPTRFQLPPPPTLTWQT